MAKTLQYDGRLEKCPLPLVKTKLLLKQLSTGQTLTLLLADPGSIQDIPRLLFKLNIPFEQILLAKQQVKITIIKE
ncbi:sulfurtransferase TusA family protein [Thalassotalea psychrophila]|uniref:Sulfurtransferase TusA family protein n=1 Tax=Thalassotalea psychrophila TaxID=3065647 RepID=A0ABY9TQL6_9GAMM|nr:sulfurtransferase TusA family protein [Colwelliaceae bacterium SQ149]